MSQRSTGMSVHFILLLFCVLLLAYASFTACGGGEGDDDDDDDSDDAFGDDDDDGGWDDDDSADDDDDYVDDDDDDDATPPPPEPEEDVDPGTKPRICEGAVFVVNEEGDFVSRINISTLDVVTIEVGQDPEVMRATDDCNHVITLNTGDSTASVVEVDTNDVTNLKVRSGLNSLLEAPGGRFVLAYHEFTRYGGDSQGFDEISIIDLQNMSVRSMAIGFPPDKVVFTANDQVVLLSEITLAIVSLHDGSISSLPTGLDVGQGQKLKKVDVTADGDYALILAEASMDLLALDLSDQTLQEIDLGCYPTDLDVSEQSDVSLLVCRNDNKVIVLNNNDLSFQEYTTTEIIGSGELTSNGQLAILFTNSESIEKVHLLNTSSGDIETFYTYKPLIGASIAPGDQTAILLHYGGDNNPIDEVDQYFDTHDAFSIMNLDDGRINTKEVPETPTLVSFGDDGSHAVVPFPDQRLIVLADLAGGLDDRIYTPSRPLEIGVVSDLALVFALQDHPLGRISFYDVYDIESVRTITGFLLNGQIEE